MKRLLALTVMSLLPLAAHATKLTPPNQAIPAATTLFTSIASAENLRTAEVTVELGLLSENPRWQVRSSMVPVLVRLMSDTTVAKPGPTDNLWRQLKPTEPHYKGLTLRLTTASGQRVQPLRFYNGQVKTESGHTLMDDPGRKLEFWLFGSARIKRDQQMADRALPILSFDQCRLLGNPIIETKPRQCLLADGGLLLETDEQPTAASLKATDFDSCLLHGKALIYTFPRRCVAAGGRVFTEPPRVYETSDTTVTVTEGTSATSPSRPVKKARGVKPAGISPTQPVSPTVLEERQGLGLYAVAVSPEVVSGTVSVTTPVSVTVNMSASVPVSGVVPTVSPVVVVSAVVPVSASVTVSATPVSLSLAVSPSLPASPTAAVSNFEVTLGPVGK